MRRLTYLLFFTACLLSACTAGLQKDMDALSERVSKLETLCAQMQQNLDAIPGLIAAATSGDMITSVSPITEGGIVAGYTISFGNAQPVSIYNGTSAPAISVAKAEDGLWYWTIGGEYLLDGAGNKVRAEGAAPLLKMEGGRWFVSYDGGLSYAEVPGTTTIKVTDSISWCEFAFGDQTVRIWKEGQIGVDLSGLNLIYIKGADYAYEDMPSDIDAEDGYVVAPTVIGADGVVISADFTDAGKFSVALSVPADAPDKFFVRLELYRVSEDDISFVSEKYLMFEALRFSVGDDPVIVEAAGGVIPVGIKSNSGALRFVPAEGSSWLKSAAAADSKAFYGERRIYFKATDNTKTTPRQGVVYVTDNNTSSKPVAAVHVTQWGTARNIEFKDAAVLQACIEGGLDTDADGAISYLEALGAENLAESPFKYNATIVAFPELEYFGGLISMPAAFHECCSLSEIVLPSGRALAIGENAFRGCTALEAVTIPTNVTALGKNAFRDCTSLTDIYCHGVPPTLGENAFGPLKIARLHTYTECVDSFTANGWDAYFDEIVGDIDSGIDIIIEF